MQAPVTNTTVPTAATAPAASAIPAYMQPIINAIPGLMNPITTPLTMDPAAQQAMANQVTRQNQQATNIAAEQLREKMAANTGGMMAPGESGLADTALASIYRGGAANTANTLGAIAAQQAEAYPQLAQNLQQLNLARLLAGGNLGQMLAQQQLAGEQFGYGKEMDALQMLMNLYGGEQGYQQAAWSPYYQGIVNAYGG
jgi:hypothetical protein